MNAFDTARTVEARMSFAHNMASFAFADARHGRRVLLPMECPEDDGRSLTGRILGDPRLGFSALDREAREAEAAMWWRWA